MLWFATPLIWLRRRVRPHKISLCRVEGNVNGGTETLSLLCGAVNQHKNYLLRLAFGGERRETGLGQVRCAGCLSPTSRRRKRFSARDPGDEPESSFVVERWRLVFYSGLGFGRSEPARVRNHFAA